MINKRKVLSLLGIGAAAAAVPVVVTKADVKPTRKEGEVWQEVINIGKRKPDDYEIQYEKKYGKPYHAQNQSDNYLIVTKTVLNGQVRVASVSAGSWWGFGFNEKELERTEQWINDRLKDYEGGHLVKA